MVSRVAFLGLLLAVACERLLELAISERHRRALVARGAREFGRDHYPAMVAVHTGLLVAAPLEVWLLDRPFVPALGWAMVALVAGTMALRYWVVATLGARWTTRVLVLPGEPRIRRGPYRWLRHPNYVAVVVEVAALPLVHTAWGTAIAASVANAAVLAVRVRVEDRALDRSEDRSEVAPES